jgi:hypothetical protein
MESPGNGSASREPAHHFRIDAPPGSRGISDPLGRGRSGRRLVTVAVLGILVIWSMLYIFFVKWRAGYRARVSYASVALAPTVDPLSQVIPPNVDPATWAETIAETHAMLDRLAGSGVLDMDQIQTIRADLNQRVAHARPDTAIRDLVEIWSGLDAKARPIVGSLYPDLLRLAMATNPLSHIRPEEIEPSDWHDALIDTQTMLVAATASGELRGSRLDDLAKAITLRLSEARPDMALRELTLIWDDLSASVPAVVSPIPRPEILRRPERR